MGQKTHPIGFRFEIIFKNPFIIKNFFTSFSLDLHGYSNLFIKRFYFNRTALYVLGLDYQLETFFFGFLTQLGHFINRLFVYRSMSGIKIYIDVYQQNLKPFYSDSNLFSTQLIIPLQKIIFFRPLLKKDLVFFREDSQGSKLITSFVTQKYKAFLVSLQKEGFFLSIQLLMKLLFFFDNLTTSIQILLLNNLLLPFKNVFNAYFIKYFRKHSKNEKSIHFFNVLSLAFFFPTAALLSRFLGYELQRTKNHKEIIFYLGRLLQLFYSKPPEELPAIQGVLIQFKGRINGVDKAEIKKLQVGKLPLHTLNRALDYAFFKSKTVYGIIGIKIWICYLFFNIIFYKRLKK